MGIESEDLKQTIKEFIVEMSSMPEGSERCIYYLFEPPRGTAMEPLEK